MREGQPSMEVMCPHGQPVHTCSSCSQDRGKTDETPKEGTWPITHEQMTEMVSDIVDDTDLYERFQDYSNGLVDENREKLYPGLTDEQFEKIVDQADDFTREI